MQVASCYACADTDTFCAACMYEYMYHTNALLNEQLQCAVTCR